MQATCVPVTPRPLIRRCYLLPFDADLEVDLIMNIALLATGGTIAMTSGQAGGATPTFGAQQLAEASRGAPGIVVSPRQILQKASASVSLRDVQTLADAVEAALFEGYAGVVVTHGTDTLEETAFALCALLRQDAPVVLTGAMRAPDQLGADGAANIAAAVAVAASPQARGLGPLVVFGDEIHAAALARKHHGHRLAAFTSAPFGPLGHIVEGRPQVFLKPRPFPLPPLRIGHGVKAAPVLLVGMDLEPETIEAFAKAPICGLVLAGAGGGHVSARSADAIEALAEKIPVVLTSRTGGGEVLSQTYGYAGGEIDLITRGLIPAGSLSPVQARILLQMLSANDLDVRAGFSAFCG